MKIQKILVITAIGLAATLTARASTPALADLKDGDVLLYAKDPGQGFLFSRQQVKNHYAKAFYHWAVDDIGNIPQKDAVLFVGNGTFSNWETLEKDMAPLNVINRSDRVMKIKTADLFGNFLTRYQARAVVIYEGENSLGNADWQIKHFINHMTTLANTFLKSRSDVQVYIVSPKPSPRKWKEEAGFAKARAQLKTFAASHNQLHYVDIVDIFTGPDGKPDPSLYQKNQQTPNAKAYTAMTRILRRALGL